MYKELLAQTPLIALPLTALFIFLGVFIVVVLRATTRARRDVAYAASLPLFEENGAFEERGSNGLGVRDGR